MRIKSISTTTSLNQTNILKYFSLLLLTFITCANSFCQTNLTIELNKNLDPSKLKIYYIDAEVQKFINPVFADNTVTVNEKINSRYARIVIIYPDKFGRAPGVCFLINREKSSIKFNEVSDAEVDYLSNYKFENLIDVNHSNFYKGIDKYANKELQEFKRVIAVNKEPVSDSLKDLQESSYEALALKQMDYIKSHGEDYFIFEKFISDIVPSMKDKYLPELYELLNSSFPEKYLSSYEGKAAKSLLEGKLYVKVGMQSPHFNAEDYLGNEITSEHLKGKYYLVSFWASWCSPCIEKMPLLKKIRDDYDENKLSIISITRDKDSSKFIEAMRKYEMNWQHVFNSPSMESLFGQKPIPSLYLIDNTGKIIFSSWEIAIDELEVILKKEIDG